MKQPTDNKKGRRDPCKAHIALRIYFASGGRNHPSSVCWLDEVVMNYFKLCNVTRRWLLTPPQTHASVHEYMLHRIFMINFINIIVYICKLSRGSKRNSSLNTGKSLLYFGSKSTIWLKPFKIRIHSLPGLNWANCCGSESVNV
jgi:hypothetical protein